MNNSVCLEYIDFVKKCIYKYFKLIMGKNFDKGIFDSLMDTYIKVRYYNYFDIKYKNVSSNINYYMKNSASLMLDSDDDKYVKCVKDMFYLFQYVLYFDDVITDIDIKDIILEIDEYRRNTYGYIDDEVKSPYFNFNITNTFDYYLVKEDFGKYKTDDRIDRNTYMELSDEDKKKCTSALISLSFDPRVVILDMTNSAYLNAYNVSITKIDGYDYVNGISFKMDSESSETVKFYKADTNMNYSYPIVNDNSIVSFSYSQQVVK